jgi:hypothetical protein
MKAEIEKIRAKAQLQLERFKQQIESDSKFAPDTDKARAGVSRDMVYAKEGIPTEPDRAFRLAEELLCGNYQPKRIDAVRADGHLVAELVVHMVRLPKSVSDLIADKIYASRLESQKLSFQSIGEAALLEHMARGGGFEECAPKENGRGDRVTHTLRLNPDLTAAIQERVHQAKRQGFRRASFQRLAEAAIHHYLNTDGA